MFKFKEYLIEKKNTHMEHAEDDVLNGGVEGTRDSINALRAVRDMLAGHSKSKVDISVKWDGAPAVFAGQDPTDGKFFVAKKGVFNKNPKVYKTPAEIDADTSGDLATKLKACLMYLPKINIKGVIQGDLLFTQSDLKTETIEGESYVTFHPNTLVYAVPSESEQEIVRNMHGIVKEMRNELSSQFRKKNIHTINWFNEILKKYYSLGGYIDPIRADEMYSAKAIITFDGNYRHPDRSINSIKAAIVDAIESTRGFSDVVSIQQILIEDVYDVEELSDSKEG